MPAKTRIIDHQKLSNCSPLPETRDKVAATLLLRNRELMRLLRRCRKMHREELNARDRLKNRNSNKNSLNKRSCIHSDQTLLARALARVRKMAAFILRKDLSMNSLMISRISRLKLLRERYA